MYKKKGKKKKRKQIKLPPNKNKQTTTTKGKQVIIAKSKVKSGILKHKGHQNSGLLLIIYFYNCNQINIQ